jgi:hypothetical protein
MDRPGFTLFPRLLHALRVNLYADFIEVALPILFGVAGCWLAVAAVAFGRWVRPQAPALAVIAAIVGIAGAALVIAAAGRFGTSPLGHAPVVYWAGLFVVGLLWPANIVWSFESGRQRRRFWREFLGSLVPWGRRDSF